MARTRSGITSNSRFLACGAEGVYALDAAAGLIIAHGTWLASDDFARFIHHGTGTAAIDWEAAIGALDGWREVVSLLVTAIRHASGRPCLL